MTQQRKPIGWYVAEMVVNTTAVPEGDTILDWPDNVQDAIYGAIEKHEKRLGRKYEIVRARADKDIDTGPYIHVVIRSPKYKEDTIH